MRRHASGLLAICLLVGAASSVGATPVLLDFEGLKDLQQIGNFYNGGAGGAYGVTFSKAATALVDQDAGGHGNFANEPSPSTIMFFDQPSLSSSMSVAGGFTTISFSYTSLWFPAVVTVLGGATGTTAIASQVLPKLPSTCGRGDPTGSYSCWKEVTLAFSGTAQSIKWTGVGNFLGIDNISLNTVQPVRNVPEPASFVLLATAATVAAAAVRRRRKAFLHT